MSQLLDRVVEELAKLPGVGHRTAMRYALHLLKQPEQGVISLSESISNFRTNIKRCSRCNNLSDTDLCPICQDMSRDSSTICVVENVRDLISIEHTGTYRGRYHILGGVISPMQGVSPSQLKIDLLVENVQRDSVKEVIMALSTTIEAETTMFYITRRLKECDVRVSNIARGIGFGDQLDYADEITLVHALNNRITMPE